MKERDRLLVDGFVESARLYPHRPAISIQDAELSYGELSEWAARIGATLQHLRGADDPGLIGVFGHRSFAAFAGVLGALMSGGGYVPLNPSFPAERTAAMINRARLSRIVVESSSLHLLSPALPLVDRPLHLLVADNTETSHSWRPDERHRLLGPDDLSNSDDLFPSSSSAGDLAYLLFTSGSTGRPKGVMVSQRNVMHFVDVMVDRYGVTKDDRFSQTFDLTFDLSAFDMFVAWQRGACVCCPTQGQKLFPNKYIESQRITMWFSVPSTAILMKRMRMLKPGMYPSLRYSLFCGEALPLPIAEEFQRAAPGSIVENLYGPTELTIACTVYRYDRDRTDREAELGVVPIGEPYPGMTVLIVDDNLQPVPTGEPGELLMTGMQLSLGYWEDRAKTANAFVVPPGRSETYYRTGDRVKRRSAHEPLLYLGRVDNQIKVQGYRVELGEIESAVREAAETDTAIAIGHPMSAAGAEGIIVFVGPTRFSSDHVKAAIQSKLPQYMQPSDLVRVDQFPLNANGKVDRAALLASHLAIQPNASSRSII